MRNESTELAKDLLREIKELNVNIKKLNLAIKELKCQHDETIKELKIQRWYDKIVAP
jgi:hypothetical protein